MLVYVLDKNGYPLMPCSDYKARVLLEDGKAKVVKRTPFTIQLLHGVSGYKQEISLGVDAGYLNIGISAVSNSKELYSAEIKLRSDMVKLLSEKRTYRRTRRNRNTRYRQARFDNRAKAKGWLSPSITGKFNAHLKAIYAVKEILPITKMAVEVSAFDIQKIQNPAISGTDYQNGVQKDFWNVREYVLYRDGHKCQHCHGKSGDPILEVHHIESRQTGGDRPGNLLTLCKTCHDKVSAGNLMLNIKHTLGFKAETFMTMVRWMLVNKLRKLGNDVSHTYGYITKGNRINIGLLKSHINDAFIIAGGNGQQRLTIEYSIQQVRKCNRKLFKGDHSQYRNTAPRLVNGFQRYDKVLWNKKEYFIAGRRSTGFFALKTLDGLEKHPSVKSSDCRLLESARTFLIERRTAGIPPRR
ncbi:MAG: RNA-guided endonuclease IscB [Caldisericia bacterium]